MTLTTLRHEEETPREASPEAWALWVPREACPTQWGSEATAGRDEGAEGSSNKLLAEIN